MFGAGIIFPLAEESQTRDRKLVRPRVRSFRRSDITLELFSESIAQLHIG
jgi:hypothetical protein